MIADGEDKMPSVGDLYALRVVNRQNLHWVVNGALTVHDRVRPCRPGTRLYYALSTGSIIEMARG